MSSPHPLDPLSRDEIVRVVEIVRQKRPNERIAFKAVWLLEPLKEKLAPYLDAERNGEYLPVEPERRAEVLVVNLVKPYNGAEIFVNLTSGQIERWHQLDADQHVSVDYAEVEECEKALYASKLFLDEISKFKLPEGAVVVADPWIYGADNPDAQSRMMHFLVYMRDPVTNDPNSNHYAFPLPIVPVIDVATMQVTRIDKVYTGDEADGMNYTYDPLKCTDHLRSSEYDPALRKGQKTRAIKPLLIQQPEGPSFELDGYQIRWQDWKFRIGFNHREGLTLHDVSFKGRQLFYRISLSDMTVPYGDPRPPLHRKQAFDLGDNGAGMTANSLKLGCDCLGLIKYFDGFGITRDGTPVLQENVICLHEQDNGLMWKHTHYRTNHGVTARSRILVLQTTLTVANYEYVIRWQFDQAAAIHLELQATGILSTQHIDANKSSPYGTVVAPGVLAAHHQHIFSVRVDPAIDGNNNSLVYDEVKALPWSTPEEKKRNPYGTGFVSERTVIDKEGWADAAPHRSRVFKVINESNINPVSGKPVGYKFYVPPTQTMLAHPDSTCFIRADFADHHLYATKYRDGQLYAGGKYTNQSRGTHDGLKSWIKDPASIKNEDLVLWFNFGLTHVARVEDFPVMPVETMTLSMKPADFFTSNPAGDLPASVQDFNQSQSYESFMHSQGSAAVEEAGSRKIGHGEAINGHAHTNGNGSCCH